MIPITKEQYSRLLDEISWMHFMRGDRSDLAFDSNGAVFAMRHRDGGCWMDERLAGFLELIMAPVTEECRMLKD